MNKIERTVYDFVKSNPVLKQKVRNTYQGVFDLMPRKREFSANPILLKEGFFFGFHDISPFSMDNSKILAHKLKFDFRMPTKRDAIEVGYLEYRKNALGNFNALGETRSWNYHKGSRLQWVNEEDIIFNCVDENNHLGSQIVNTLSRATKNIRYPIDSVSADGKWGTTFSYERLQKFMPGYGYVFNDEGSLIHQKAPDDSGFYLLNLEQNKRELLLSLRELYEQSKHREMAEEGYHYVTHSLFSPGGQYVSFLHRWVREEDTNKRFSQLVVYNRKEKNYQILPLGLMVSHYDWNKNNEIIAYCNFNNVDCHALLNVEDFSKSREIAYPQLNSDGHQSFINSESFITDTYPDKFRMAKMYQVNIQKNQAELIASLYSPKKFQTVDFRKHIACDLHPTTSQDGQFVCFDTVKTGKRALAVMRLN